MRAVRFQETDRVPVYDILGYDAVLEHHATICSVLHWDVKLENAIVMFETAWEAGATGL